MKKIFVVSFLFIYSCLLVYGFMEKDNEEKGIETLLNEELYNKIISYSNEHNLEMVDSKFDKIYKKIPGVNGYKVDIEGSYQNMLNDDIFDEKKIIFKEIVIKTEVKDLPIGPIYRGNRLKDEIALLINVSWGEEYIDEILKILNDNKVKATFFIEGNFALKNKEIVKKIFDEGHEIGSHSLKHQDFSKLTYKEAYDDLLETNKILQEITKEEVKLFAPPSGSFNEYTFEAANNLTMETILFDCDTIDWQKPSVETIINRVMNKVTNGSFILMHPTENTVLALPTLIEKLKKNYQIFEVSEVISPKRH